MTATSTETVEPVRNSAKREIIATVISTAVVIALGMVTSGAVTKIGQKVRDQIAPPNENN